MLEIPWTNLERYGPPGSGIVSSDLLRSYCPTCGEPIRVKSRSSVGISMCDDCTGFGPQPAQRVSTEDVARISNNLPGEG